MHKKIRRKNLCGVTKNRGFTALLTVVVLTAATLLLAYTSTLIGLGELDAGFTAQKGNTAFAVADGCVEEVLRRIKLDATYGVGAGPFSLSLPQSNSSCSIEVRNSAHPHCADDRCIIVTGTNGDYNKRIEADVLLSGTTITLTLWEEQIGS
jgi:hypothetical protein